MAGHFNWKACRHRQRVHLRLDDLDRRNVLAHTEWLCKIILAESRYAGLALNECLKEHCPYTDRDDVP